MTARDAVDRALLDAQLAQDRDLMQAFREQADYKGCSLGDLYDLRRLLDRVISHWELTRQMARRTTKPAPSATTDYVAALQHEQEGGEAIEDDAVCFG